MITPDSFQSEDEAILAANLKKIDLLTNQGWVVCIGKENEHFEVHEFIDDKVETVDYPLSDESRAMVERGIQQAKEGKVCSLRSFAEFADLNVDDDEELTPKQINIGSKTVMTHAEREKMRTDFWRDRAGVDVGEVD
jgi:hypothetical protein